jgi:hypothetical protein
MGGRIVQLGRAVWYPAGPRLTHPAQNSASGTQTDAGRQGCRGDQGRQHDAKGDHRALPITPQALLA